MKAFAVNAVLALGLCSCIQGGKKDTAVAAATAPASELQARLEAIYNIADTSKRADSCERFFRQWNAAVAPGISAVVNQDDTIRAVFDVFRALYKPFALQQLGEWEWGNKLNANARYVAVQDKIYYSTGAATKLLLNFMPVTDVEQSRVIYLNNELVRAITGFLGEETAGAIDIMEPALPAGESRLRYKMLRPFIPILHGHSSGWIIPTAPVVKHITLNRELTEATASIRVGYEGGETSLRKTNGQWSITSGKATWIE